MKNYQRLILLLLLMVPFLGACPGKSSNSPTSPNNGSGSTPTFTPTVTGTLPTATSSPTATPTGTPTSTATSTSTGSPTSTVTLTATSSGTPTSTATGSPTSTASRTATSTTTPTASATPTNTFPTSTPTSTATSTATASATRTATNTATSTATPTPTNTIVYTYSTSFGSGSLSSPYHIAAVGSSPVSLFVTDQGTNKVVILNGGTGALISSFSTLNIPEGLAVNSAGTTVYVAEVHSGTISYIEYYTAAGVRQTGLETTLTAPDGIDVALDSAAGKLYALSEDPSTTLTKDAVDVYNVGNTSRVSSFSLPASITSDLNGICLDASNVYIATDLGFVSWYTKSGTYVNQYNISNSSTDAYDVKPDGFGNFLIAMDLAPGSYIQKMNSSFSPVQQFGNSQLNSAKPTGVASDSSGTVYVVDQMGNQIFKYTSNE